MNLSKGAKLQLLRICLGILFATLTSMFYVELNWKFAGGICGLLAIIFILFGLLDVEG